MNDSNLHPLVAAYVEANPGETDFPRKDLLAYFMSAGTLTEKEAYKVINTMHKSRFGHYSHLPQAAVTQNFSGPVVSAGFVTPPAPVAPTKVDFSNPLTKPAKNSVYVPWGNYSDVKKVIKSGMFYPLFISGLSGNGKTMMVEQACAALGREYVRVQITPETDENDLLGGYRLVDGNTVFEKGPVVWAMEAGAILLLDEIDRGTNKMMALQGVMEGKPVLLKKTGEVVYPRPGFNVIATANTKGRGSDDGKFVAATIIDEAFLERFPVTLDQPYPPMKIEAQILAHHANLFGLSETVSTPLVENLVKWSETIRVSYDAGSVDEVISTRRLCHVVQAVSIFGNATKAVDLCVSRFDEDNRAAFLSLYKNLVGGEDATLESADDTEEEDEDQD